MATNNGKLQLSYLPSLVFLVIGVVIGGAWFFIPNEILVKIVSIVSETLAEDYLAVGWFGLVGLLILWGSRRIVTVVDAEEKKIYRRHLTLFLIPFWGSSLPLGKVRHFDLHHTQQISSEFNLGGIFEYAFHRSSYDDLYDLLNRDQMPWSYGGKYQLLLETEDARLLLYQSQSREALVKLGESLAAMTGKRLT